MEFRKEDIYKVELYRGIINITFNKDFFMTHCEYVFNNQLMYDVFVHDLIYKYDLVLFHELNETKIFLVKQ